MKITSMILKRYLLNNTDLRARTQQGFTLIEMMVVISILGILLAIAMPSFSEALLSSKLRSYANNLVASVHLARSEAIKRNAVVTLCASSDGTSCSGDWKYGWVILSAGDAVIQTQQAVDVNFKITGTNTTLSFQPTGVGATQDAITICRETPTTGSQERVVTISATGRPSVTKTSAGSC